MDKKRRSNIHKDVIKNLRTASRYLTEDYEIMGDGYPEDKYADYDRGFEQMPVKGCDACYEEKMGDAQDMISKVRELALSALQEYANDVDSEIYQFFKKIWLMCDKMASNESPKDENEKRN